MYETTLLIIGLLLATCNAARHPYLPPYLLGRPTATGFVRHGDRFQTVNFDTTAVLDVIDQKVDNFDQLNNAVFKQRYWRNSNFTQNNNIVFLMIQGESPATPAWISNPNYQYLQWAKEFGADVFQLEHRCFGQSRPYRDLSYPSIKVCTMEQALQDIHNFIQKMNVKHNYNNPKWVTFGGSYPGTLSALFRAHYPSDTVGAIASSAPLQWTLDFYQYAQVVEATIKDRNVDCWKNVNSAFINMQQMSLRKDGIQKLNTIFRLDPPFSNYTQHDIDNFFANVYSFFQGVVQYTYDGRNNATINGLNVDNLCSIMNDGNVPDVVARVKYVINWVNQMNGDPVGPFPNSYSQMMQVLSNVTFDDQSDVPGDIAANRGWMWLCCNELGVLQTTDQGRNIFQQTVPLNYFIDMCTDMFDPEVNVEYIRDKNKETLYKYNGNRGYYATNCVLPNGSYDPWHVLGTNSSSTIDHLTPILIPGAAHCSDMYPSYPNEPAGLSNARKIIHSELKYFLGIN